MGCGGSKDFKDVYTNYPKLKDHQEGFEKIGEGDGGLLTKNSGDDDIKAWLMTNKKLIMSTYQGRLDSLKQQLK